MKKTKQVRQKQKDKDDSKLLREKSAEIVRLKTALNQMVRQRGGDRVELPTENNTFSFGLIGDTHLGSNYERLSDLRNFYLICKKQGINIILHCGDVLDGHKMYRGQEFEQHKLGWDKQLSHFVNDYPDISGMTTYFITGNHDESFTKLTGMDVGEVLSTRRSDFIHIGNCIGSVEFKTPNGRNFIVGLQHPDGGTAYAISYHPQRIVESLTGGKKPHFLGIGHYHKANLMPAYRNVCSVQSGCYQGQTPFMARKASAAHVGGWIINFTVGQKRNLTNMINSQFIACY